MLDTLSEREAGVVSMRFGLTDGQPKTLDEIGKVYGVTRERIRQIESKTMSKLRHPSRSQVLRDYLDLIDNGDSGRACPAGVFAFPDQRRRRPSSAQTEAEEVVVPGCPDHPEESALSVRLPLALGPDDRRRAG